jgi:hypothetical protein
MESQSERSFILTPPKNLGYRNRDPDSDNEEYNLVGYRN